METRKLYKAFYDRVKKQKNRVTLTAAGRGTYDELESIVCTHPYDCAPIGRGTTLSVLSHELEALEARLREAGWERKEDGNRMTHNSPPV